MMFSPSRNPISPGWGLFLILILIQPMNAQKSTARFLLWQPSALSHAMGGVGTALHEDAFAMYYNPSALAFSRRFNAVGSLVKPLPFFGNTVHSFTKFFSFNIARYTRAYLATWHYDITLSLEI
jgi:hypothetical protein